MDGILSPEALGVSSDFVSLVVRFVTEPGAQGALVINDLRPQKNGPMRVCSLLRAVASCMRARELSTLVVGGFTKNIPDGMRLFMNKYWGSTHGMIGDSFETWTINIRDQGQNGASCLFD